jgi:hypothetical protein
MRKFVKDNKLEEKVLVPNDGEVINLWRKIFNFYL